MSEKLDRDDPDVRKMVEREMLACLDEYEEALETIVALAESPVRERAASLLPLVEQAHALSMAERAALMREIARGVEEMRPWLVNH